MIYDFLSDTYKLFENIIFQLQILFYNKFSKSKKTVYEGPVVAKPVPKGVPP